MPQDMITGRRAVFWRAIRDSLSLPVYILLTMMMGFGSLARVSGFEPSMAVVTTLLVWGGPGQFAMVDLTASGHSIFSVVMACSLANARFLPMVVSFLPTISHGLRSAWPQFVHAQLLSINSWAMCLRAFPGIDPPLRRFYYVVFAVTILSAAVIGTLLGYHASGALPAPVVLGLVFLGPLFFALVLLGIRDLPGRLSLVFGCAVMLPAHWLVPEVDLVLTGVVGGSFGFFIGRRLAAGSAE